MSADDHGSASTYNNHKCRCDACRSAWTERQMRDNRRRAVRRLTGQANPEHGKYATYTNWRCRCDLCRAANSARQKAYKQRKAAEAGS